MQVELPLTTPQQRQRLWVDVEQLLTPGFLSHPVTIMGVPVCLRSPFPQDTQLAEFRAGPKASTKVWQQWILAGATWMVQGTVLFEDQNAAVQVQKLYAKLPDKALNDLFMVLTGLWRRYSEAVRRAFIYCYEDASRLLWQNHGGKLPTGLHGLERLGLNHVQQSWVAYNNYKDESDKQEHAWTCAKLVASAMAKINKLEDADKSRLQEREEARQRALDTLYYQVAGLLDPDDDRERRLGEKKTVSDLEEEMRMWVAGEQDWHDEVVANYKAEVRRRKMEAQQAVIDRQRALAALHKERAEVFEATPALQGYTLAQLAEVAPQGLNVRRVIDVKETTDLYNRHVVGQRIAPKELAASAAQPNDALNAALAGRQVRLSEGEG